MADVIEIVTDAPTVVEVGTVGPQGIPGSVGATGPKGDKGDPGTGIETLTTKGDLLTRDDNGAARVGIGSEGQVLKVSNTGLPAWENESGGVPTSRTISAGTGLTGGGDLTANRTLTVAYGTTSGTACQGNDARLSDSRTPTAHAASHLGGVKAYFAGQVGGMTENVFIRANNAGTAGNSITLTFDGVYDVDTVLAAWNSANPSNQATLVSGDGAQVPDSGEEITFSNGAASGSDPINSVKLSSLLVSGTDTGGGQAPDIMFKGKTFFGNEAGTFGVIAEGTISYGPEAFFFTGVNESVTEYKPLGFTAGTGSLWVDTNGNIGIDNTSPEERLDVAGNFVLRDVTNSFKATFDADDKLSANRTYDLPDRSGELMIVGDAPASHTHGNITNDGKLGSTSGLPVVTTTAGAVTTLALGTAGQVLTVNGTADGVEFAAASGGGTSIMRSIAVGFVLS